ncbi:rod shape-determining protein RodA [Litorivicinus lipolyticus]|uniref:Peptidoglycan glycosyltransferase MrdB n=1 Tax=Litorivicinus lipolyticus TaxID=418701 RepID=A0A5Q2QFD2_9GAMM|nr:rod shape-determining protein RodA [Litorivicinus lipolyticus]QGG81042.1 rod shape-determining protein RodA [Litorivicinus lipolyticus]
MTSYADAGLQSYRREPSVLARMGLDGPLLLGLIAISAFGLYVLYSASGQDMDRVQSQAIRLAAGFSLMVAVTWVRPHWIRLLTPIGYGVGILLLIAVLVAGTGAKGAQRWLDFPGLPRFQPSELLKVLVPLMVALWISRHRLPVTIPTALVALGLVVVPVVLVARQPDLGTSLLIAASGIFVILLAGLKWRWIAAAGGLAAVALPALWLGMREYQRQRVLTFLDPESDPLGTGWNIIQSKTAIGAGGLSGKGWLMGSQAQLDFLPESHTDFIIAVLAEELGLLGVLVLLILYLFVIARGLWLASNAHETWGRLLAGALTLTFFVYLFVNIGMVSGLLPVVGVPLPLVSYGGTSAMTLLLSFGLIMATQREKRMVSL